MTLPWRLSEAARVGHSWGKGGGLSKGGSLLRLVMYLCLFLFPSGRWPDAMGQTDREAYGSELCVSETRWVSSLWLETWSFRQWIWSLSRLLILKMALAPSVESLSTFEFLHDFMTLLIFYLPPSRQSGPWGAGRAQSPWLSLTRGRSNWRSVCPSLCSHGIL